MNSRKANLAGAGEGTGEYFTLMSFRGVQIGRAVWVIARTCYSE